ncbi:MAG: hypothetical protein EBU10_07555, partial [Alphaproteobacteria bacterium]|nr:hypothetical protein [Alphaproteobacteria bacterium]
DVVIIGDQGDIDISLTKTLLKIKHSLSKHHETSSAKPMADAVLKIYFMAGKRRNASPEFDLLYPLPIKAQTNSSSSVFEP